MESSGLPSSHITAHGNALEVHTTVGHTNRLFNTHMHHWEHNTKGTRGVVALSNITIPDDILPYLAMVWGVQSFPFPISHNSIRVIPRPTPRSSTPSASASRFHPMQNYYVYDIMVPRDLSAYYGYPDQTQFGRPANYKANTSIAVIQFDGYDSNNAVDYESISPADVASQGTFSDVPGIQSNPTIYGHNVPANAGGEASLDIQTVTTNNPLANATHWEENTNTWIYNLCLHLRAQAVPPQVVSISYSTSETQANDGNVEQVTSSVNTYISMSEVQLTALGAMGVTVIAASGDNGANGGFNQYCVYTGGSYPNYLYVEWPASSPHVVSVGATALNSATTSTSESNTPWCGLKSTAFPSGYTYDPEFSTPFELACVTGGSEVAVNTNFRSGGGFSRYYSVPSWQNASTAQYLASTSISFPLSNYYVSTNRGVPDVSMYGAGVGVIMDGMITDDGGTSLASPLFAVIVSLLNAVSINAGGSTLGYLNPLLYYMAANVSGTFKDITSGDNKLTEECYASSTCGGHTPCNCAGCQGFTATTGWDAVTGLGSPKFSQMAAYVKQLAVASSAAPRPSSSSSTGSRAPRLLSPPRPPLPPLHPPHPSPILSHVLPCHIRSLHPHLSLLHVLSYLHWHSAHQSLPCPHLRSLYHPRLVRLRVFHSPSSTVGGLPIPPPTTSPSSSSSSGLSHGAVIGIAVAAAFGCLLLIGLCLFFVCGWGRGTTGQVGQLAVAEFDAVLLLVSGRGYLSPSSCRLRFSCRLCELHRSQRPWGV